MPWTKKNYPNAMKNLPEKVRNKAIEIANALIYEKAIGDEGILIATAISRAKDWAENRHLNFKSTSDKTRSSDVKEHGKDMYVTPHGDKGWAVKTEGEDNTINNFDKKSDAVEFAKKKAKKANTGVTIQKRTGKIDKKISYNPRKTGAKAKSDK